MLSTVELTWNIKTGSLLNKLTNVRIKWQPVFFIKFI